MPVLIERETGDSICVTYNRGSAVYNVPMPENAVKTESLPPEAQIVEMVMAQFVSRLIHLTATLKLPDYLAAGPKTADELAPLTATHAPALYRVMRTLASLGLFTEDQAHRFTLQPLGAALKSGTPSHATALIMGGDLVARSLDNFLYSVQTGKTGSRNRMACRCSIGWADIRRRHPFLIRPWWAFTEWNPPQSPQPTILRFSKRLPTWAAQPEIC